VSVRGVLLLKRPVKPPTVAVTVMGGVPTLLNVFIKAPSGDQGEVTLLEERSIKPCPNESAEKNIPMIINNPLIHRKKLRIRLPFR
jgi:hypothetical protein